MAKDLKLARLFYELEAETKGLKADLDASETSLAKFAKFVAANPVAALGALSAAAITVGVQVAKMAEEVDEGLRKTVARVPGATKSFGAMQEAAKGLSVEFGIAQTDVVAAMEAIAKGGVSSSEELIAASRAVLLAQKATGDSAEDILAVLDTSVDAFGGSMTDAEQILADLIATTAGRTNLADLGEILGKVGPKAAAAGVDLNSTAAAIALIQTKVTDSKQQVAVFNELLKGGADNVKAFAKEALPAADSLTTFREQAALGNSTIGALSAQLKETFKAELISLGRDVLPLVIGSMKALVAVVAFFSESVRSSRATANLAGLVAEVAKLGEAAATNQEPVKKLKQSLDDIAGDQRSGQYRRNLEKLSNDTLGQLKAGWELVAANTDRASFRMAEAKAALEAVNAEIAKRPKGPVIEPPPSNTATEIDKIVKGLSKTTKEKKGLTEAEKEALETEKAITAQRQTLAEITALLRTEEVALLTEARRGLEKLREEMIRAGGEVVAVDGLLRPLFDRLTALEKKNLKQPVKEMKIEVGDLSKELLTVDANLGDITDSFEPIELTATDTAFAVAEIAISALDAAAQFGIISGEAATALGHIVDIGYQINALKDASFTQVLAGLPGIISSLTGLLGTVFGDSPADQERKRILKENTKRLEELNETSGDLVGALSTGRDVAGVGKVLGGIDFDLANKVAKSGPNNANAFLTEILRPALQAAGLTFSDLDQVAKDLGIQIRDKDGRLNVAGLQQLLQAIDQVDTAAPKTFRGKKRVLEDEISLGIRDESTRFGGLLAAGGTDNAISRAISGIDVSTDAGRAQATNILQQLFQDLNAGKLKPGDLGDLSRDDFSDLIQDLIGILTSDAAIAGPGNQGSTDPVDVGDEIATSFATALDETFGADSPAVDYLAEIARNTAAFSPVAAPNLPASLLGPSTATGPGAITLQIGTIQISVAGGTDPAQTANEIADTLVDRLDRALYDRYRQSRATAGLT